MGMRWGRGEGGGGDPCVPGGGMGSGVVGFPCLCSPSVLSMLKSINS